MRHQDLHLDAWTLVPWAIDKYGDRLATVDRNVSNDPSEARVLTYAELGSRSVGLARHLAVAWGIRRGSRIGVMKRNSASVVEIHFAAAALHAVVVNVNVSLAPRELAHVLHDSGCEALIADAEFAAVVSAAVCEDLSIDPAPGSPPAGTAASCAARLTRLVWDGPQRTDSPQAAAKPSAAIATPLPAWMDQVQYTGGGRKRL